MNLEEEVKQLVRRVGLPPEEQLPEGTTEEAILAFEARTGLIVPASLRKWLRFVNGPCVGPGGVLGIGPKHSFLNMEEILRCYPEWRENGWIPVAGDGCGNYYILNTNEDSGPIYFIDTALDLEHLAYVVASCLWRFLWFILKQELGSNGWPFLREYVTSNDPDIIKCVAAPAPWDA